MRVLSFGKGAKPFEVLSLTLSPSHTCVQSCRFYSNTYKRKAVALCSVVEEMATFVLAAALPKSGLVLVGLVVHSSSLRKVHVLYLLCKVLRSLCCEMRRVGFFFMLTPWLLSALPGFPFNKMRKTLSVNVNQHGADRMQSPLKFHILTKSNMYGSMKF